MRDDSDWICGREGQRGSYIRFLHLLLPATYPSWKLPCHRSPPTSCSGLRHISHSIPILFPLAYFRTSCSSVMTAIVATTCTVSPRPCLSPLKVSCPDLLLRTIILLVTWKILSSVFFMLSSPCLGSVQNAFLTFQLKEFSVCTLSATFTTENSQPRRKQMLSRDQSPRRNDLFSSNQSRKLKWQII